MEQVPLWLPPLPLAIIALTLLVSGALIWFRADNLGPPQHTAHDDHDHSDEHDHGGHAKH